MRKMTALIIIVIALVASLLTGCLKPVSLDEYGYVVSVGIDRGAEGGYYYVFALQRALSEQNVDSEGGAIILACEGANVFEAINEIEGNIPYSLNFSRVNFIIVSRDTAEEGVLRSFVSTSFDSLRIRTSAVVIVSDSTAKEFIGGMYANNDANIAKLQSALMLDREKTGMVTFMSVSRLIEACSEGCFDFSSALGRFDKDVVTDTEQKKSESEGKDPLEDVSTGDRVGGLKSYIEGAAVFSEWRMTGTLTREETMFMNMVTGEFENGVITLEYDGGGEADGTPFSVLLTLKRKRMEITGETAASVTVELDAAVHMKDERITAEEADAWLTGSLPGKLEAKLLSAFLKLRGFGSDAMRFGTEFVKKCRTESAWKEFRWKERYKDFMPEFHAVLTNTDKYLGEDMQ